MEGERLAELRKGRKIGQKEFAELMGISVSALSKYERNVNEPEDALKKKFAEYFNVSMDYLMAVSYTHLDVYKRQPFGFFLIHDLTLLLVMSSLCNTIKL